MRLVKLLESIETYILYVLLALFPVFILSSFASPYIIPKQILLVGGISLLIILWSVRMVIKGTFSFSVGRFDLGVLLIGLSYLVSTIFSTPNKMEAFLFPGTTTFILAGTVLYFLINQYDKKVKEGTGVALFAGGLLLSLSVLLSVLGVFAKIPQLPAFMKEAAFTPLGGNIPSTIYLGAILVFSIGMIIKQNDLVKKLFFGVSATIILFSVIVLIGNALPGKPQALRLADMQTSWEITVDSLKKNPLLGVGPANYLTAFNLYRPVEYNQGDLWQLRFTTASNHYFTQITETGFLGLLALVVLLASTYKVFSKNPGNDLEKYSLVGLLAVFAFLPAAPILIVLLLILYSLFSHSENKTLHLNVAGNEGLSASSRLPAIIVSLPFLAGVIAVLFFGSKIVNAEATFKKSLDALGKNDAKGTYDLMAKAVNQNPQVDRYHASLAQVNMALAQSIASKADITDADRTTITQLVQQAIAEGKATVALNPSRSGNWELLAQIYRAIMPFATGADQFALQTYSQAIALDPTNPNLRISFGGVYYALGRYDDAIETFKLAVLAKSDLANAHYNLAAAYREKKDYDNAIASMNNVLALVDSNSEDYKLAKATLEELEKNRPAKETVDTENLQAPQPVEESNITPPIELPSDSTPPATTN